MSKTSNMHVQPQEAAEQPQVGDIVCMMTRAHLTVGMPYEVIGRVERDYKGLHAGNRYLSHCFDIRIVEKAQITDKGE